MMMLHLVYGQQSNTTIHSRTYTTFKGFWTQQNQLQKPSQACVQISVLCLAAAHLYTCVSQVLLHLQRGVVQSPTDGNVLATASQQPCGREWAENGQLSASVSINRPQAIHLLSSSNQSTEWVAQTNRQTVEELLTTTELHAHSSTLLLQVALTCGSSHRQGQLNLGYYLRLQVLNYLPWTLKALSSWQVCMHTYSCGVHHSGDYCTHVLSHTEVLMYGESHTHSGSGCRLQAMQTERTCYSDNSLSSWTHLTT